MSRPRPALGTPFGADGPWLAAILDVLGDIHDLLDDRLPQAEASGGEPVRVEEPAVPEPPTQAVPVQEPAPVVPPTVDDDESKNGDGDRPVEVAELAPATERPTPTPPPRGGPGSGLAAWRTFAEGMQVRYGLDDNRDDIIAACERAGVIEAR